ncbi:MAG: DUF5615 family PIN-like protein [Bacteroidota bacterium]
MKIFRMQVLMYLQKLALILFQFQRNIQEFNDESVMDIAIKEERIILTFDSDYGTLVFREGYKPSAGVIYFRWQSFRPSQPGEFLKTLLLTKQYHFKGFFTVIGNENLRQHIIK